MDIWGKAHGSRGGHVEPLYSVLCRGVSSTGREAESYGERDRLAVGRGTYNRAMAAVREIMNAVVVGMVKKEGRGAESTESGRQNDFFDGFGSRPCALRADRPK